MFISILVGVIFFLISFFMYKYISYYKKNGTRIKAICYGYEIKKMIQANKSRSSLKVLLKYQFNREEIISSLGLWSHQYKYKIGEEVPLYILLNKGAEYILVENSSYKIVQYMFGFMGLGALIWGVYLTTTSKNLQLVNWIELIFCLYAVFVLYKIYNKIKPELNSKILKTTKIETDETLADPKRNLILHSRDIESKKFKQFRIGLLITFCFFVGLNGLFYFIWNEQPTRLKEAIIKSVSDIDLEYFMTELQNKNPLFLIFGFGILINILMVYSYFKQIISRNKNEF